jgi:Xaa-Pro dipeptidase
MHEKDREIIDVAEHTDQVMFQKTTRPTRSGIQLPMLVHERLAYSPEEYIRRYDVLQGSMARLGLDALLVRGPENITYVIGYETPGYYKYHCVIVPRGNEPVFLVRDFEWLNTPEFSWCGRIAKVYDWDHPPAVTANVLQQLGLGAGMRVGVEKQCFFYTVDEHETLKLEMPTNEFVDATEIVWNARMIKS